MPKFSSKNTISEQMFSNWFLWNFFPCEQLHRIISEDHQQQKKSPNDK